MQSVISVKKKKQKTVDFNLDYILNECWEFFWTTVKKKDIMVFMIMAEQLKLATYYTSAFLLLLLLKKCRKV